MPRKPRIQFEGAIYHVINRGNYRRDVFETGSTAQAFEQCLYEACEQSQWQVHAYTLMRNHYHLAVATPRGNLVEGMHWLQSTFATRFNRLRQERGHLFQSRYQAILVQPGPHLARVVNYIHLNPVSAGIVPVAQLAHFRWSSYRRFLQGGRPSFLVCADWLEELGGLHDTPAGWRNYQDYLAWLATDTDEQKRQSFASLTKGWAIGSETWRKELAKEHVERLAGLNLQGGEIGELKEAVWTRALNALLANARKTRAEATEDWYGADWKLDLADQLRQATTATNAWIARELTMGSGSTVSVYRSRRKQKINK
jgi:putative transposase